MEYRCSDGHICYTKTEWAKRQILLDPANADYYRSIINSSIKLSPEARKVTRGIGNVIVTIVEILIAVAFVLAIVKNI